MKIFGVILIFSAFVFAQSEKLEKKGVVTYLSSQNVYVKFDDTEGIAAGDTLFVKENSNYKPVLVVNFISSRSAAGETIKEGNLKVGDAVFVFAIVVKKDNDQIQDSIKQLIDSKIPEQKLITPDEENLSKIIRERVKRTRQIQKERFLDSKISLNSEMSIPQIKKYCPIDSKSQALLKKVVDSGNLSARGYHRVLRVARTIADLEEKESILFSHLSEALMYRLEKTYQ